MRKWRRRGRKRSVTDCRKVRHFLKKCTANFPSPRGAFREITRRLPFYMALTELRIARNDWLDWNYRRRLVWEAHECLLYGLKQ